jgi:NAD(P) transhydrogenase subunit beta
MGFSSITVAYLVASVLFILSLSGLSNQETARKGNWYGILGMLIAIVATLTNTEGIHLTDYVGYLAGALGLATVIGYLMASRVAMTGMPELVALLHSFVGLAAVLVGFASYLDDSANSNDPAVAAAAHTGTVFLVEVFIDVFIGAITFTGSILAFLKLKGSVSGSPLLLPGRHLFNLVLLVSCVVLGMLYVQASPETGAVHSPDGLCYLGIMAALAGVLGYHLVAAIGGADMPVVVSMLNSYSGWTASAAGFMLGNDLLIITGALVGSSGAILSYIMCRAMNRSIVSVIFGGFGTTSGGSPKSGEAQPIAGEITEIDVTVTVEKLLAAREVIIVPGYGLAVARAQHTVRDLTQILRKEKIKVRFGIHPVAGRLPGHMNVLLAEANLPYDIVMEMDEINDDFPSTEVCLVIGANDIVNPGAQTDTTSPIYGMPVLEAWKAGLSIVFKRSRRTGYAGVDNPLFYNENNRMLYGDAKDTLAEIVAELRKKLG